MVYPNSPGLARNLEVRGGRDAAAPRLRISRPKDPPYVFRVIRNTAYLRIYGRI